MPIKNYTTSLKALQSVGIIQGTLVAHGAVGIQMMYDSDKRIASLAFALPYKDGKNLSFQLPCNWKKFRQVLIEQNVDIFREKKEPVKPRKETQSQKNSRMEKEAQRLTKQDDFAYNVAWANLKDWILAQMALYETEIVDMPQIFLPFMTNNKGQTIYEQLQSSKFLLGSGE